MLSSSHHLIRRPSTSVPEFERLFAGGEWIRTAGPSFEGGVVSGRNRKAGLGNEDDLESVACCEDRRRICLPPAIQIGGFPGSNVIAAGSRGEHSSLARASQPQSHPPAGKGCEWAQCADYGPSRPDPRNREVRPLSVTRASRRIRMLMLMPIRDPAGIRRGTRKVGNFGGLPGRRPAMLIFKVVIAGRRAAKSCLAK